MPMIPWPSVASLAAAVCAALLVARGVRRVALAQAS
jgi:hypothetical protein